MNLPFFNSNQKIWVGPLGILAFLVFYMVPNHIHLFTHSYLYMFPFENGIPFIDWTIWIYISDYLYIGLVFMMLKNKENMNKIFYSQMLMLFFAMIIFFMLPTAYPRPEIEYIGFSGWMIKVLYSSDTPGNACPSIHVAMTFLAGFGFIKEQKRLFIPFMVWAVLISLSTLTVKQHYVVDIIAGFTMAVIFYYFGQKWIEEKTKKEV